MQKNVLFVNLRLSGGGSEKVMAMLANSYADTGIPTQMLLLKDDEKVYPVSKRVEVIECYCPHEKSKLLWHIKRFITLRKAIRKSGADTVISFMWDINMKVILACLGLGKHVIVSERADPCRVQRQRSMKFAQKWIFPHADVMVFQTKLAMEAYPANIQKKGVVIPNPMELEKLKPCAFSDRKRVVVAAGRFTEQKNFEMLIQAFAIFAESYPEYRLVIYGDGPLRKQYEALITQLRLSDRVVMPGFAPDVTEKMRDAMIYASSSNFEGISNAMLEAQALGIPSVCTDCPVGGAAMTITNGINGILVDVGNYKMMAEAFQRIEDDPVFAKSLSENEIINAKRFSIDEICREWLEL